jgi:hypothetical protein
MKSYERIDTLAERRHPEDALSWPETGEDPDGAASRKLISIAAQAALQEHTLYEPVSDFQTRKLALEIRQRNAIYDDILFKLGSNISDYLTRLDLTGKLAEALTSNRKINDRQLPEKLGDYGFISPEMAAERELNLTGIITGLILTDKTIPEEAKHNLTGLNRHIAKDVIEDEINSYVASKSESN